MNTKCQLKISNNNTCYSNISDENLGYSKISNENTGYSNMLRVCVRWCLILSAIVSIFLMISLNSYATISVSTSNIYPDTDTKIKVTWAATAATVNSVKYYVYRANASDINDLSAINVSDRFTWTNIFEGNDTYAVIDGQVTPLRTSTSFVYKVVSEYTAANNEIKKDFGYASTNTTAPICPIIKDYAYNVNTNTFALELERLSRVANRYRVVDSVYNTVYQGELSVDELGVVSNVVSFTNSNIKGTSLLLRVVIFTTENNYSAYSDEVRVNAISEPFIYARVGKDCADIDGPSDMRYFRLQRATYTAGVVGEWSFINPTVISGYTLRDKLTDDNTYVYRLIAREEGSYAGFSNISAPVCRASGISDLKYTIISGPKVKLMWKIEDKGFSTVRIEKKVDDGYYNTLVTLDSSANQYFDSDIVVDKNYSYRFSVFQTIGTGIIGPEIPVAIKTPVLSMVVSADNSNELHWEPKMSDSLGVTIEKKVDNGDFDVIASNYVEDVKYIDTDLAAGHSYTYRIKMRALEFVGKAYSNEVNCYNSGNVAGVSNLEAITDSRTSIKLKWSYSSPSVIGASIQRKADGDLDWTTVTDLNLPLFTYTDTGLAEGTKYYYRVRAGIGSNVYSAYYPEGDDVFAYTKPKKPEGLSGIRDDSGRILLSWIKDTKMTRYDIFRKKMNENEFTKLAEVTSDTSTWMDEEAVWKLSYKYRIAGILEETSSEPSDDLEIKQLEEPVDSLIYYVDGNSLFFKWNLKDGYSKPVNLEKKDDDTGEWKIVAIYDDGDKIFEYKNVKVPGDYKFKITGVNTASNKTVKTDEIVVSTKILEKPETLRLRPISTSGVRLTWVNKTQKCDGFVIFRVFNDKCMEVGRTSKDVTVFDDSGLSQGETYTYYVSAYASNIFSPISNYAMITMPSIGIIKIPISFSWSADALREMDKRGAIPPEMLTDSNFFPKNYVTRAEFVTMLIRMSDMKRTISGNFKDVLVDSWYKEDIAWAKASGIVAGGSNGAFNPDAKITRQDIAVVLYKMLALNNKNMQSYNRQVLNKFSDNNEVAKYAESYMSYFVGENLIKGVGEDVLAPRSYATRAEAITLIFNVLCQKK